jgi:hypothetical protein
MLGHFFGNAICGDWRKTNTVFGHYLLKRKIVHNEYTSSYIKSEINSEICQKVSTWLLTKLLLKT